MLVSGRHFGHYKTALCLHFILASTPSNPDSETGDGTRAMVEGVISDAGKDLWGLLNNQAAIDLLNGGRFQRHQQDHLRDLNSCQCKEVQAHAEEVYSKRNRLADNGTLSKVLFYDIV